MKALLFLLLPIGLFAQQKIYPISRIEMVSGFYGKGTEFCYFDALQHDSVVEVRIKVSNEPIIGSIYICTNYPGGDFAVPVDHIGRRGFSVAFLLFRQIGQWKSIDAGIKTIEFATRKSINAPVKWHKIEINSNLNQLKNFAK